MKERRGGWGGGEESNGDEELYSQGIVPDKLTKRVPFRGSAQGPFAPTCVHIRICIVMTSLHLTTLFLKRRFLICIHHS